MKIGLVLPYNITLGGGVAEIVNHTAEGLRERGHDVKIVTPQPRKTNHSADNVIMLGGGSQVKSMHTTFQASASVDTDKIDKMLDDEKFDLLHFHEPWVPVLSRQILSRSKAVNVATFHAAVPETLMSKTIVKVVTPYALSILKYLHEMSAVSDAAAVYIRSLTDRPVQIIPNGIDLTKYRLNKPRSVKVSKEPIILYIGRLEKRKGVRYLIKAFALVQEQIPNSTLVLAGDGPEREKLEKLCSDLKIKNVEFLGYVPERQKTELLEKADLFCSPALYGESFGIVLLEAMAMDLVTVAGNNSGYAGLMKDVGALSIVNPKDSDEFGRRLLMLLQSDELRQKWQEWASKYVKQFSYDNIIDQYEDFYKQALSKHAKQAS